MQLKVLPFPISLFDMKLLFLEISVELKSSSNLYFPTGRETLIVPPYLLLPCALVWLLYFHSTCDCK